MNKKLVIIKLGGSVITDKSSNKPIFKTSVVKRLAREILEGQKKSAFDLILIHGAGSFGHPYAKKYRLNEGYSVEKSIGIAVTKNAVLKLNSLVIEEMINAKLNSCLVETSSVAKTSNKKISLFNLIPIKNCLSKGIIPVLSGDVVEDAKLGISILSGDQLAVYLAKKLKAYKIIFVSDVDGVFDKNPKINKDARLIKEINRKNYQSIINNIKTHNQTDTTGEMKGKILALKENLSGVETIIINGLIKNRLKESLFDRMHGTRILF